MPTIRNVVFDFGNVLFDLDIPRVYRRFQEALGEEEAERAFETLNKKQVFQLYETGGMSSEEFLDTIRLACTPELSRESVLEIWNSIFLSMPRARFDFLLNLRKKYQVFLLSNINAIHEQYVADYMEREHGILDFENRYFDGYYYSHLIRMRKPNPEIYEYLLADADLKPAETIFFDDLEENIEAAKKLGIIGVHKPVKTEVMEMAANWLSF
ncbi:MAG: HAD family phosphatase [Saprospiraceae bacterium]